MSTDQLQTAIGWVAAGAFIVAVAAGAAFVWTATSASTYQKRLKTAQAPLPPSQVMGGRSRLALGRIRVQCLEELPPSQRPDPVTVAADARIIEAYAAPGVGRHAAVPPTMPTAAERMAAGYKPVAGAR